jgi:AAA+ superfamily predicted ATPase
MRLTSHVDCSLWDGLLSGSDQILVLGATNRIQDIDPAFLRRMPRQISVSLPNAVQREKILSVVSPPTEAPLKIASFLDKLRFFAGCQYSRRLTETNPRHSEMSDLRQIFLCNFWPSVPRECQVPA